MLRFVARHPGVLVVVAMLAGGAIASDSIIVRLVGVTVLAFASYVYGALNQHRIERRAEADRAAQERLRAVLTRQSGQGLRVVN
jgi:hypothetical protein